ncbi:MAG: hypothetical protein ABIK89_24035 [Planctomycetota bacterium]
MRGGDETLDFPAVNLIMGHVDRTRGATYRERIADERLVAVVKHVHKWLFGAADDDQGEKPDVVPFSRIG